jgi:hypothetical protein
MKKKLITLNQLHQSGKIWWIKSLPTLKKWVFRDKDHNNLLKVQIVNEGNAPRYYFLQENVDNYVKSFNEGKEVGPVITTDQTKKTKPNASAE